MQYHQDSKPLPSSLPVQEILSPGKILGTPFIMNQYKENRVEQGNISYTSPSPSRLIRKKGFSLKDSDDRKNFPLTELDSVKKTLQFETHNITTTGLQNLYSPQRQKPGSVKKRNSLVEKTNILKFR
jgi:hypothetical protein